MSSISEVRRWLDCLKENECMRLDRVLSEGEAQVALQRMGFQVRPAPMRAGLYEIAHPSLGGARTATVDQMCFFAEGAAAAEQIFHGAPVEGAS